MTSNISEFNQPEDTEDSFEGIDNVELKERLIREVSTLLKEKKPTNLAWTELKNETGIDCKKLWNHMRKSTAKKLNRLLKANDLLKCVPATMRLSATDWQLFDRILVHEKIDVTNCKKLPQCINDLNVLVKKYDVEKLSGDELAEAWIHITLQYNERGRQCSPMLLQLRWYQLKELSREQVYNPASIQDPDKTRMLHGIAIKFQKIITQPFPKWEALIKQNLVILPEKFLEILGQELKWSNIEIREGWYLHINEKVTNSDNKIDNGDKPVTNEAAITVDSHDEMDDMLCEKEEDCINTDPLETHHELHFDNKDAFKSKTINLVDIPPIESNSVSNLQMETIKLDSDDEINNILLNQVQCTSTESPRIVENPTDMDKDGNIKKGEKVKRHHKQTDKDPKIINKLSGVDEKKRKKIESKTGWWSIYDKNDNSKKSYDPKLLMNVKVSTKKLDTMRVFRNIDYGFVNNKKVIEYAILESKPNIKRVSKYKDIAESTLSGYKMDGNHIKGKEREKPYNKIKYTSWLLQKPKNIRYMPIQLRKNPDFNNELKLLTSAFLDSARNKTLLKNCKPLTIDLHKEFEKELINGIMYVEDFKSAPNKPNSIDNNHSTVASLSTSGHKKEKHRVSVLRDGNNISTEIAETMHDPKRDTLTELSDIKTNQVSSQCTSQRLGERRRIINLPNIDQIREFNLSLQTAEVTPICNDTTNINCKSCTQLDKVVPCEATIAGQVTQAGSTIKVKNKFIKSEVLNDKNIYHEKPSKN